MGTVIMVAQDAAETALTSNGRARAGERRSRIRDAPRARPVMDAPVEGGRNRQRTYFDLSAPKESAWTGVAP
jgi:hypothetical protein